YPKIFDLKLPEDYRLLFFPYLVKCYCESLGYGFEEDPPQKRYARLLFVTVYFKIIFDHILKKSPDVVKLNPDLLEPIFKKFEINQQILSLTDETMVYYFSRAREYYSDHDEIVTWHNFFSHHAWNEELQKSIKSFLTDHSSKIKEIKEKLK
ncbi:MAG: hypothetical protein WD512_15335, partial [Candidatus Paceibacterota bacterium]